METHTNMQPTSRPFYRQPLVIGAVLLLVAVIGIFAYVFSTQSVTVTYDAANVDQAQIFKAAKPGTTLPQGEAVQTLASGKSYRLAKGSYVLVATGEKITTSSTSLALAGQPVKHTITTTYSPAYLAQLLPAQQAAITAAIKAANPRILQSYKFGISRLYGSGDWYGTTLTYIGTDKYNTDSLRLVAHREGSTWIVDTNPPQLILTAKAYPKIPHDVLSQVNAIDPGQPK